MKSGTGDDPFADSGDEPDGGAVEESPATGVTDTEPTDTTDRTSEIPYKFRRDSVKADRNQRPIFLRSHVEDRESEFLRELEAQLGEDVYKTDALEAAIVVAMDNPELVAEELREWGYDWD